jgi:hypothetical protein
MADDRPQRAYQADAFEDFMAERFGMFGTRQGRGGLDAEFEVAEGQIVPFELKSTDRTSFSTARDVGREHIEKWRHLNWLFGIFERGMPPREMAREFIYASPRQLSGWLDKQEAYVGIDWDLVERVPQLIDISTMHQVVGEKPVYGLVDAKRLLKSQRLEQGVRPAGEMHALLQELGIQARRRMTSDVYRALMDRGDGFSPERMLILMRERCRYLIDRGATRNNPHISIRELRAAVPPEHIVQANRRINFSDWLRRLVRQELAV